MYWDLASFFFSLLASENRYRCFITMQQKVTARKFFQNYFCVSERILDHLEFFYVSLYFVNVYNYTVRFKYPTHKTLVLFILHHTLSFHEILIIFNRSWEMNFKIEEMEVKRAVAVKGSYQRFESFKGVPQQAIVIFFFCECCNKISSLGSFGESISYNCTPNVSRFCILLIRLWNVKMCKK